jgi:hypothetical protein
VQPNGPLVPSVVDEYRAHTGREVTDDFPDWEPCHRALLVSRFLPSLYVAERRDDEPVELPW